MELGRLLHFTRGRRSNTQVSWLTARAEMDRSVRPHQ
jgi:hypothetical protein